MCGGTPIASVLVECKAQHSGKWEQRQHRTSFDQLHKQYKCTVMGEMNEKLGSDHFPLYRDLPLYEAHQIRRAATSEPTLLE